MRMWLLSLRRASHGIFNGTPRNAKERLLKKLCFSPFAHHSPSIPAHIVLTTKLQPLFQAGNNKSLWCVNDTKVYLTILRFVPFRKFSVGESLKTPRQFVYFHWLCFATEKSLACQQSIDDSVVKTTIKMVVHFVFVAEWGWRAEDLFED